MATAETLPGTDASEVNVSDFVDPELPESWSRQMIALLRAGHYREGYEVLADKVPFVETQLRPYAERLAGKENHWTITHARLSRFIDDSRPQRILDLGCAVGCHAIEFARQGHQSWGMDVLPCMIERGRELIDSLGLAPRCHLVEGDIRFLERYFDGHVFDCAVSCDTFEHLDDASLMQVFEGLCHVVRPAGTLVIQSSPGRHYYWFEPTRRKLLTLLAPFAWLPDRAFTAYVRGLERGLPRRLRREHVRFYRHEYGHINCMDPVHLGKLMRRAGLQNVRTFAVNAHPGFKDEGCLRSSWTRQLFGNKSIACRNVFGVATIPGNNAIGRRGTPAAAAKVGS